MVVKRAAAARGARTLAVLGRQRACEGQTQFLASHGREFTVCDAAMTGFGIRSLRARSPIRLILCVPTSAASFAASETAMLLSAPAPFWRGLAEVAEVGDLDPSFRERGGDLERSTERLDVSSQIAAYMSVRFSSLATASWLTLSVRASSSCERARA
jgi:hypothetical protein